jgi:hypothetical protein
MKQDLDVLESSTIKLSMRKSPEKSSSPLDRERKKKRKRERESKQQG